jgi:hypothetical protein
MPESDEMIQGSLELQNVVGLRARRKAWLTVA